MPYVLAVMFMSLYIVLVYLWSNPNWKTSIGIRFVTAFAYFYSGRYFIFTSLSWSRSPTHYDEYGVVFKVVISSISILFQDETNILQIPPISTGMGQVISTVLPIELDKCTFLKPSQLGFVQIYAKLQSTRAHID